MFGHALRNNCRIVYLRISFENQLKKGLSHEKIVKPNISYCRNVFSAVI